MRTSRFRTLAALVAAVLVAGCGDAPTGVNPASARIAANGTTPLAAQLYCYILTSTWYDCTASAVGGSGSGYSFTWVGASEYYDQDWSSSAQAECPAHPNIHPLTFTITVWVTVTDGNGATATTSRSLPCPTDIDSYYWL